MADSPEKQKRLERIIDEFGEAIYGIRWGLIPMYLGLWIAIIAYNVHFFQEIFHFLVGVNASGGFYLKHNDGTSYLLWILALIDITMIGNLVVMTTVGGYSTFVKEFNLQHLVGKPRWMNGLDSSTLKIKMGMSLVAVSGIHLLKTFMDAHEASWDTVLKEVVVHVTFIITTLAFTLNALLMHKHHPKPMTNENH